MTDIALLIHRYLKEELTEAERQELESWKDQSESNRRIFQRLTDDEYLLEAFSNRHKIDSIEIAKEKIHAQILANQQNVDGALQITRGKIRPIWPRLSVAAAIIVLVIGVYFMLQPRRQQPVAITEQKPVINDKSPGKDGAILKLANGQEIVLDNVANGDLAKQGTTSITKKGSVLAYNGKNGNNNEVLYNTLSTPKARQFQVVLPDGTQVWLNAESSITYPTIFTGNERNVTVTGEVYMEVAKDATKPFKVHITHVEKTGETIVEVLGTHFNINAYSDEMAMKTTLLEGKVKISQGSSIVILKPGQQAQVLNKKITTAFTDVEQAVAWKFGYFSFSNVDLKTVMRQLERWYDIEVVYSGGLVDDTFNGKISKNSKLSDILNTLETNQIHFKLDGNKLIVSP